MGTLTAVAGRASPGQAEPVVRYVKRGVRIAELYFDQEGDCAGADIVRYHDFSRPVRSTAGVTVGGEAPTRQVNVLQEPEEILAQMRQRGRRKVRDGAKMGLTYECTFAPGEPWANGFYEFFDQFAPLKRLAPANRERLEGMREAGILFLSRVRDGEDGSALVWHAAYVVRGVMRMLHSASLFRAVKDEAGALDREFARKVADANGYQHWRNMLEARGRGCHTYDFGSWYEGSEPENLRINEFKESFGGEVVRLYSADAGLTVRGVAACYARRLQGLLRGGR